MEDGDLSQLNQLLEQKYQSRDNLIGNSRQVLNDEIARLEKCAAAPRKAHR
jgi:hypothetical protein